MECAKRQPPLGAGIRPVSLVDRRVGLLLVALSALVWGSLGVTTKGVFNVAATNAYSVTLLRALIALSTSLVICALVLGKSTVRIARGDPKPPSTCRSVVVHTWVMGWRGFFFLRNLCNKCFGRQQQRRDRRRVGQRCPHNLGRIDHTGLDQILVLLGLRVESPVLVL